MLNFRRMSIFFVLLFVVGFLFADEIPIIPNLPSISYGDIDWGDYDNDGDLDLVMAGYSSNGAITRIYRNDNGKTLLIC